MKKKPKMLLFSRSFNGYEVDPHSVISWLYYKKAPKLAEDFCKSFNKVVIKLEKEYREIRKQKELKKVDLEEKYNPPPKKSAEKKIWWRWHIYKKKHEDI